MLRVDVVLDCGCAVWDCVVRLCRAVAVVSCGGAVWDCVVGSCLVVLFGCAQRMSWCAVVCVHVLCEVVV